MHEQHGSSDGKSCPIYTSSTDRAASSRMIADVSVRDLASLSLACLKLKLLKL